MCVSTSCTDWETCVSAPAVLTGGTCVSAPAVRTDWTCVSAPVVLTGGTCVSAPSVLNRGTCVSAPAELTGDMFVSISDDVHELAHTISDYISFCVNNITPSKQVKVFPNNKP